MISSMPEHRLVQAVYARICGPDMFQSSIGDASSRH